jgi:Alginate export
MSIRLSAIRVVQCLVLSPVLLHAQDWDIGSRAATAISSGTNEKLKLTFEQRGRYEDRTGTTFGKDPDVFTGLFRTRLGLSYTPVKWLKFSGMVQDSRAPWYGSGAPNTVRDQADLHEGYIEIFPSYKEGFGMTAGRMMLNYGEGRLIGTPQWSNLSRTYDHARAYWRSPKVQVEVLMVSPVKIRIGEFNQPVLGDRVWGTYDVFPDFYKKNLLEAYVLRHDQNRPGGFTGGSSKDGTDKIGVNTFGFRLTGPVSPALKYSLEAALQKGMVGPADLSASAWFAALSRRWTIAAKTLDVSAEYKYASGTENPADPKHSGTFDQLYAANHDKFGHQDLFGWRNIHNARSLTSLGVFKNFTINFMYDNYWLANLKDGVYNGSGKLIVRSAAGTAGRHVGQETDLYGTYKRGHFTFGAGYGRFFSGTFIQKTTPGVGPTYLYVFHTYSL